MSILNDIAQPLRCEGDHSPPIAPPWTRKDLARAAWERAGTPIPGFDAWWQTRVKAMSLAKWRCPSLLLAIAAWNGARGRDSFVFLPAEEGAVFETWYGGLSVEQTEEALEESSAASPLPQDAPSLDEHQPAPSRRIEVVDRSEISSSDDKFFFSPDAGKLVLRGDFFYTEYGYVLRCGAMIRLMPIDSLPENYADWTEERRHEVRTAVEHQCRLKKIEETVRQAHRDLLVEQARTKLTEEEFEALYDYGFKDGSGY